MKKTIIALSLLMASPGFAASFDCTKAETKVETLICSDSFVSTLDNDLNKVYSSMKNKPVEDQRAWIKNIRDKQVDVEGLTYVYSSRIEELANLDSGYTQDRIDERAAKEDQINKDLAVIVAANEAFEKRETKSFEKQINQVVDEIIEEQHKRYAEVETLLPKERVVHKDPETYADLYREHLYNIEQQWNRFKFRVHFEWFKFKMRVKSWFN